MRLMLATPLDLEDFALGFSLTEGILVSPAELYGAEEVLSEQGITLQLDVSSAAFARLKDRRRSMTGRTGCGLCGTENLAQVARELPVLESIRRFGASAVSRSAIAVCRAPGVAEAHGGRSRRSLVLGRGRRRMAA